MARYKTQIQWSPNGQWHDDADLVIEIHGRRALVPEEGTAPTGTTVTWLGPCGSGSITFFNDANAFCGSLQLPGEGPVGFRGQLKK